MTKTKEDLTVSLETKIKFLETKIKLDVDKVILSILKEVYCPGTSVTAEEFSEIYKEEAPIIREIIQKKIIPQGNQAWEIAMIDYITILYKNKE